MKKLTYNTLVELRWELGNKSWDELDTELKRELWIKLWGELNTHI